MNARDQLMHDEALATARLIAGDGERRVLVAIVTADIDGSATLTWVPSGNPTATQLDAFIRGLERAATSLRRKLPEETDG